MHAAVLHTIGAVPQYEEFSEPVIADKEREVIVHVHAASLKPIDKQLASGSHYASRGDLPRVCGSDGVGHLDDGQRVFFGGPRPPHGAMAQRTVVPRAFTFPIPENVNDETAAALPNPAVSAWLSLAYRAKLARGENVLILGATGVTGKLAIKIARLLGAARVVAAGRNQQAESAHFSQDQRSFPSIGPRIKALNLATISAKTMADVPITAPLWFQGGQSGPHLR